MNDVARSRALTISILVGRGVGDREILKLRLRRIDLIRCEESPDSGNAALDLCVRAAQVVVCRDYAKRPDCKIGANFTLGDSLDRNEPVRGSRLGESTADE